MTDEPAEPPKRGRGRPPGAKDHKRRRDGRWRGKRKRKVKPKVTVKQPKPKGGKRPGAGAPSHVPTPQNRRLVEGMVFLNKWRQEHIARVIGIDMKTLRKYYREELETSKAKQSVMIEYVSRLKAVGGPPDPVTGQPNWREADTGLLKFYLERACGMAPSTMHLRHSGAIGSFDLTKLSDEELSNLEAIRAKIDGPGIAGADSFDAGDSGGEGEEGEQEP